MPPYCYVSVLILLYVSSYNAALQQELLQCCVYAIHSCNMCVCVFVCVFAATGMLSQQELLQYDGAMLTEAVVKRVFEECQTYEGEMDFKSFLDFVLAIQNRFFSLKKRLSLSLSLSLSLALSLSQTT